MPAKNNKIPSTFNDDSDEEVLDFDSKKIDELFKNYDIDSSKKDLERITRFFEDGENNDCLICKKFMSPFCAHLLTTTFFIPTQAFDK